MSNTADFLHFKLHADSTLKSMTKDKLISYIHMLYHNWDISDEQLFNCIEFNKKQMVEVDYYKHEYFAMCDLFDNPQPYKFEDLKSGMWIWDEKFRQPIQIRTIDRMKYLIVCGTLAIEFNEYRFFPITKAIGSYDVRSE